MKNPFRLIPMNFTLFSCSIPAIIDWFEYFVAIFIILKKNSLFGFVIWWVRVQRTILSCAGIPQLCICLPSKCHAVRRCTRRLVPSAYLKSLLNEIGQIHNMYTLAHVGIFNHQHVGPDRIPLRSVSHRVRIGLHGSKLVPVNVHDFLLSEFRFNYLNTWDIANVTRRFSSKVINIVKISYSAVMPAGMLGIIYNIQIVNNYTFTRFFIIVLNYEVLVFFFKCSKTISCSSWYDFWNKMQKQPQYKRFNQVLSTWNTSNRFSLFKNYHIKRTRISLMWFMPA